MATCSVFLSEEAHRQRSLVGYSPGGHKSDTTQGLSTGSAQMWSGWDGSREMLLQVAYKTGKTNNY